MKNVTTKNYFQKNVGKDRGIKIENRVIYISMVYL